MRIAICTDIYLPQLSGVSDSIAILVQELKNRGHEVRIYAPNNTQAVEDPTIFRLPSFAFPGTAKSMFLVIPRGMIKDLKRFKPDIMHTHTFSSVGIIALYAHRKLKIPLVGTDHTFPALYLKYARLNFWPMPYLVKKFAAWYYGHCTYVTTPSKSMLQELQAYGMNNSAKVISNPIDMELFQIAQNRELFRNQYAISKPAILIFQRLAIEKNLDFSLDIFKDLKKNLDAQLLIVGEGPHRASLEARVLNEHIPDVHFYGVLRGERLVEIINAADVYLITSIENQAMTMLQTMTCGLPIVGADIGGLPEYIIDGETGFLCNVKDKNNFVRKIITVLQNPQLREKFATNGNLAIKGLSSVEITSIFENLYSSLIETKKNSL